MYKSENWPNQVIEKILFHCVSAGICHIFVDRESNENCVYIKAVSSDDGAEIFQILHVTFRVPEL